MIHALLQLLLTALGAVTMPDLGVLGLAAAVLTVAVLALAAQRDDVPSATRGRAHPLRAIGRSVLLAQSDPRAEGHPRPRAPGEAPAV